MKKRDTVLEKLIAVSRLTDACVMALDELITRVVLREGGYVRLSTFTSSHPHIR